MDDIKRKVIVKEIEYWRASRLLPDQYCDFLLNLYLEGESESKQAESWTGLSPKTIQNSNWKMWLLSVSVFTFISLIVLNFNAFHFSLQMGVSALFVSLLYWLGLRLEKQHKTSSVVYYGLGTLTMLFLGEYLLWLHDIREALWVIGYIVLCSLFWIVFGSLNQIAIVHFCGWLGFMLFYGWLLNTQNEQISWAGAQMYWLPLAIIFIWLGWLLHQKFKSLSAVYFMVGCTLWFVPEAFCYFVNISEADWLQGAFVIKLVLSAALLFGFRKKWTEWVAAQ